VKISAGVEFDASSSSSSSETSTLEDRETGCRVIFLGWGVRIMFNGELSY
jgi:hypothetical protein